MPLLVTTKRPDGDDRNCNCLIPYLEGAGNHSPGCACFTPRVVSRRAVATLEEARRVARTQTDLALAEYAVGYPSLLQAAESVPESGGTVGPLPDGTLIEVEPGPGQQDMRQQLREWDVRIDTRDAGDDLIAFAWIETYNARQEA